MGLGVDLLKFGARSLVQTVVPAGPLLGSAEKLAELLSDALWSQLSEWSQEDQRKAFDELATVHPADAHRIAVEVTRQSALGGQAEVAFQNYIAGVPMAVRRGLQVYGAASAVTTRLSQLPRNAAELQKFIPLRPPLYAAGKELQRTNYRLRQLLGQGGFGEVWLAEHAYMRNRFVAVKFFPGRTSIDNEFGALQQLSQHRNLVDLLDTGFDADVPYLIYEYIDGGDLTGWIASKNGSPTSEAETLKLLVMLCRGLAHAHASGVVHRDLKPANILLTTTGELKITDFGIASWMATGRLSGAAMTTKLLGAHTPFYADPDQEQSPKFDVYSVGVIAYQLIMGSVTRPVAPAWREELAQRVSPGMRALIECCLWQARDRVPDARVLCDAIERLRLGQWPWPNTGHAQPAPSPRPGSDAPVHLPQRKGSNKEPRKATIAASVLGLAFSGIAAVSHFGQSGTATDKVPKPEAAAEPSAVPTVPSTQPLPTAHAMTGSATTEEYVPPLPEELYCTSQDCTVNECGHYQVTQGPASWQLIEHATAMRGETRICAEVYHVDPSGLSGGHKDQFALSLGSLHQATAEKLLPIQIGDYRYDQGFLSGKAYREQVFPPHCRDETVSFTSDTEHYAGSGALQRCGHQPRAVSANRDDVWSWASSGGGSCSCRANLEQLNTWESFGHCLLDCKSDPDTCTTQCEGQAETVLGK